MSEVEERDPLENMIDFAANAEFNKANDVFDAVLTQKVQHALEQEKVALAQDIWGDAGDEVESEDVSDEDLDAAADDILEDDDDLED